MSRVIVTYQIDSVTVVRVAVYFCKVVLMLHHFVFSDDLTTLPRDLLPVIMYALCRRSFIVLLFFAMCFGFIYVSGTFLLSQLNDRKQCESWRLCLDLGSTLFLDGNYGDLELVLNVHTGSLFWSLLYMCRDLDQVLNAHIQGPRSSVQWTSAGTLIKSLVHI